jgi:glycosyltransferase involved in cell wall biosynthesis
MVANGSTGKIMLQIAMVARKNGCKAYTFSIPGFSIRHPEPLTPYDQHTYVGTRFEHAAHFVLGLFTGLNGCFSPFTTISLIRKLKKINPDIIHLHNIHNWSLNFPILFRYIKKSGAKIFWTIHDCWSFTGQCPYYELARCNKWQTGCGHCPQLNVYPQSHIDVTKTMWKLKKKWFTGIPNMTLITPSKWVNNQIKKSFMSEYPTVIINNGIDLSLFKPIESDFRQKYKCENKTVILGVSDGWGKRKGLDVFIELSKRLPNKYQIVLVGTNDNTDKKLPNNIISIHRTENQTELAKIYTASDLFVNPTREEMFGLVNIESIACGTPVLTFRTGGSPECIDDTCGSVVDVDDIDALEREIIRITTEKLYSREACVEFSKKFNGYDRYNDYVELYLKALNNSEDLHYEK